MTNQLQCLNDFKHQILQLFAAFKNLSREEQIEVICLIKELHSSLVRYFSPDVSLNRMEKENCSTILCHLSRQNCVTDLNFRPIKDDEFIKLNFRCDQSLDKEMVKYQKRTETYVKSCSKKFPEESKDEADEKREVHGQKEDLSENFLSRCHLIENSESESSASTIETSDCALEVRDDAAVVQVQNNDTVKADALVSINKIHSIDAPSKLGTEVAKNIDSKVNLKDKFIPAETSSSYETMQDTLRPLMSCRFCHGEFNSSEEFHAHTCDNKIHNSSEKLHKCKLCSMSFSKIHHLNRHLKGHNKNNCKLCNSQFTKRKALCKHLKIVHNMSVPEKLYRCNFCDKQFSKRPSLNAHLKSHADGQHLCIKCGFMCVNESDYNDHVKDHIKNSKFECKLCDKKFVRKQQHDQHMLGHEKHICASCDVTFSTKKLLLKHIQTVHGARITVKKHECPTCKKLFLRPKHLQIHQRIHTGEKPLKCSHCEKSFCNERALSKHMKTVRHLQKVGVEEGKVVEVEKTFLCEECGSRFYRQQSLLRHVEVIHTSTTTYKCDLCDYSTKCKTNLKRHAELHTDNKRYVCEICGSSFRAFATLKEHHAFVHSDNRNFICETCKKGFKSKSSLQRHLRIHSEQRPYKCHCNRDYKRMSHLKRHMISAHHMTFKKSLTSTEDSSDIDTNTSSQDSSQHFNESINLLQSTSESNHHVLLPDSCGLDAEDLTETNDNDAISSFSTVEDYSNIPFIGKDNVHVLTESNTKSPLVTILSPNKIVGNDINANVENSILDDLNLNLSSSSYFNLTSSPLNAINMEGIPSAMQHITPQDVLTLSPGQDHLIRPQSLPNLNFQAQSDIDSFGSFSLHNHDSPNTISLSSFLLNPEMSSSQVSNLNMEQNESKHLFGETDDILSLPSYASNTPLNMSECPSDQFFNSPKSVDIWDVEHRLKLSNDDVMSNSCSNLNLNSFSNNMPSSPNSLLSHNLIFSNESLMSSTIDTNSINSDFESLSNLC